MTTTTPTAPVNTGETLGLDPEAIIREATGLDASHWTEALGRASIEALAAHLLLHKEVVVPIQMAVIPPGTLPVFLNERIVRYVYECCNIADVDPNDWVEGWIKSSVEDGLNGEFDVTSNGIAQDLVDEHGPVESGCERTAEERDALYEQFREVAFRYQQEVKAEQEATASVDGGEA